MSSRGPAFREEEDAFLQKNYRKHGAPWCAEKLEGRTLGSVRKRAQYLGITRGADVSPPTNDMIDQIIRRAYTGERKTGFVSRCALQVGRTRDWVQKRAMVLGLSTTADTRPWTTEEIEFASARPLVPPHELSKQMRRKGWSRTPRAIAHMRTEGRVDRVDAERFTAQGLADIMGVSVSVVTGWIKRDLLKAERRGTTRTEAQRGDGYVIHESDVAAFMLRHSIYVSLPKLEPNKVWFFDLMSRYARPVSATGRQQSRAAA